MYFSLCCAETRFSLIAALKSRFANKYFPNIFAHVYCTYHQSPSPWLASFSVSSTASSYSRLLKHRTWGGWNGRDEEVHRSNPKQHQYKMLGTKHGEGQITQQQISINKVFLERHRHRHPFSMCPNLIYTNVSVHPSVELCLFFARTYFSFRDAIYPNIFLGLRKHPFHPTSVHLFAMCSVLRLLDRKGVGIRQLVAAVHLSIREIVETSLSSEGFYKLHF